MEFKVLPSMDWVFLHAIDNEVYDRWFSDVDAMESFIAAHYSIKRHVEKKQ